MDLDRIKNAFSVRSVLGWSKSSKTIPSASPRKLRVFRGLPSKIPQTFKLFEGYPRNFLKLLCCSRSQSRNSRFSRIPSKKPQLGKFTYFTRILEKPQILELYWYQNKSFFRGFSRNPRKSLKMLPLALPQSLRVL